MSPLAAGRLARRRWWPVVVVCRSAVQMADGVGLGSQSVRVRTQSGQVPRLRFAVGNTISRGLGPSARSPAPGASGRVATAARWRAGGWTLRLATCEHRPSAVVTWSLTQRQRQRRGTGIEERSSVWLRNLGPCNRAAKGQGQGSEATQGQGTQYLRLSGSRSDDDSARGRAPGAAPAPPLRALSGDRGS